MLGLLLSIIIYFVITFTELYNRFNKEEMTGNDFKLFLFIKLVGLLVVMYVSIFLVGVS